MRWVLLGVLGVMGVVAPALASSCFEVFSTVEASVTSVTLDGAPAAAVGAPTFHESNQHAGVLVCHDWSGSGQASCHLFSRARP
jgi:hypothetical protein